MKYRNGFVTNSSSSSFIISKNNLTSEQLFSIRNHRNMAFALGIKDADYDDWKVQETEDLIACSTGLDNFMFEDFLNLLHINPTDITWFDYPIDINKIDRDKYDFNDESSMSEESKKQRIQNAIDYVKENPFEEKCYKYGVEQNKKYGPLIDGAAIDDDDLEDLLNSIIEDEEYRG